MSDKPQVETHTVTLTPNDCSACHTRHNLARRSGGEIVVQPTSRGRVTASLGYSIGVVVCVIIVALVFSSAVWSVVQIWRSL